jgi:hypothetical protein
VLSLKEYFNPGPITLLSGISHSISGNGLKYELSYNINSVLNATFSRIAEIMLKVALSTKNQSTN